MGRFGQVKIGKTSRAFALPTVLIASVVLLAILAVSVTATATVRETLKSQYYAQLAQVAGEAGVNYAKACLASTANVPTWTDAKPLTPASDCSGNVTGVTCPADARCSVTVNGNIRSSFSVPKPIVDSQGRALTIPNSGYVELTRSSNGSVWRTYKQPSVQNAVAPDLCSGNATAARGWAAAVKTTQQDALGSASSAQTISLADTALNAGVIYFRKDFNVSLTASYDLNVYTPTAQDSAASYVDGQLVSTAAGSVAAVQTTLTAGCHTLVVELTNDTYLPRASRFTASLTRPGAATPVVVSDTTWRVVTGDPTHFSTNNYDETPTAWAQVADIGIWNNTALPWGGGPTNWASVSGDSLTDWISTNYSSGGLNRPANSFAWLRDTKPFTTSVATTIRVTNYCDDSCDLYLDGNLVMSMNSASGVVSKSIGLQPGSHTFGIRLYNGNTTVNPSGVLFAAVDLATSQVLARSGPNWDATTSWSSAIGDPYSYDGTYTPAPAVQTTSNARVLVVGGGGGGGSDMGGGGGAGGVISTAAYPLATGTYSVTVGGGGAGAPAGIGQVRGTNGGNSVFGSIRALGGGGGGSEYSTNASPPGAGASAGGSAGCTQSLYASYVIGQGNGSAGTPGCYYPTGGGGAGGPGAANPANGGVGVTNNILGTSYFFGGGGGGSGYTTIGGNGGSGGGGGGAVGSTTGGSGLNWGSAGGGGVTVAQTNKPGGNAGANTGGGGGGGSHYNSNNYGGNGGSGIVVIAYPTGSITATGGNISTSLNPGFTTHIFYSSGTFTVQSISTVQAARNVNIAANYSQWTLSGGAAYNSGTGQLTIPAAGVATSPLMKVDSPASITVGGDFYATNQAAYAPFDPQAGYHLTIYYYGSDGVTPVKNTAGYANNGCAIPYPVNAWTTNVGCGFSGGPGIVYTQYSLYGSNAGYASPNYLSRNPQLILQ